MSSKKYREDLQRLFLRAFDPDKLLEWNLDGWKIRNSSLRRLPLRVRLFNSYCKLIGRLLSILVPKDVTILHNLSVHNGSAVLKRYMIVHDIEVTRSIEPKDLEDLYREVIREERGIKLNENPS